MRSLFWRIWGAFWLALILTGLLTFLLTRLLNQDSWILHRHPGFVSLNQDWLRFYESGHEHQAQQLLQRARHEHRIYTQVFDDDGKLISASHRTRPNQPPMPRQEHDGWRSLIQEVSSSTGENYLFVHRIQRNELAKWQYKHGYYGPLLLALVALVVLSMVSLLLTLSITRPLSRLRHAVHELGQTAYQQQHLAQLARRKDELGVLAADFNKMGQRLQDMLHSQRQLLRDVSHELRSPLARLQVGLALAERSSPDKLNQLWPKLALECQRLDQLIDEILTLARMEQEHPQAETFELCQLLQELQQDAQLLDPDQRIELHCAEGIQLQLIKSLLQRALDNLLRNALRFNPPEQPVSISVKLQPEQVQIEIRDHGPGVETALLEQITSPFVRAAGQQDAGYGLGLAITERAIRQLDGLLELSNHPEGGFQARIYLPLKGQSRT